MRMKQKLFSMLALLLTAVTGAWAQTQWESGDCTVTLNNGTMTVSGNGAMADYASYAERPWDINGSDITSVVVESGVTTVGAIAFCNFVKMTSVILPEGLTSIGAQSFMNCDKLTSVTIPSTVTSIDRDAFYNCTSVTDVNLYPDPANLTWNEDGCDDFIRTVMGSTQCHVLAEHLSAYQNKFGSSVNVTFVGDLKPLTPPTYSVTLAEGTEEADKWTVKVGEGEAQDFPVEGLNGGETVTATYSGEKKVKSVKAVKKAPAFTLLSAATTSDYGKVVCAAGHLHDAKTAVPDGCTAVGILGKVTETGHGLILALKDATSQNWNTINGWTSASYAGTTLKVLPDDDARGINLTSCSTLGETTVSNWAVAQKSDYDAIFTNLGSTKGDSDGNTYDANVNAYITTGVGGTAISGRYWSATERDGDNAWNFHSNCWAGNSKTSSYILRPVLGF